MTDIAGKSPETTDAKRRACRNQLALVIGCLLVGLTLLHAPLVTSAEDLTKIETRLGVALAIPTEFQSLTIAEYLVSAGVTRGGAAAREITSIVDRVYMTNDELPTMIIIMSVPWGSRKGYSKRNALAELPNKPGPIPASYANRFLKAYLSNADKAGFGEVRKNATARPLLYDHVNKMVGTEIRSSTASEARLALMQDDDSEMWQEIKSEGTDTALYRCILEYIARAIESGQNMDSASRLASSKCEVDRSAVDQIAAALTVNSFIGHSYIERILSVLTNSGMTLVRLEGLGKNEELVERSWNTLWDNARPLAGAVIQEGPFSRLSFRNINTSALLYEMAGAFVLVGLITFGLRRKLALKYGPRRATIIAALTAVASALVVSTLTGMGPQRFLIYPISGLIVVLILFLRDKSPKIRTTQSN